MTTFRLILTSIVFCGVFHTFNVLSFADGFAPEKAAGSLVTDARGKIVGSRLIAQAFTSERYFHPRPSACGYDASAAAGSNLSPTNSVLTERAKSIIAANGANKAHPIPADLVTASGSGLDPDISRESAVFQAARVASARGISKENVDALLPADPIVNVLELNLSLDRMNP
jgi:potassium-transporting ATPase KdpC subunit